MRQFDRSEESEVFPKWVYGPGGASMIVNGPAEIPVGFVTHPRLVREDGSLPVTNEDTLPLTREQVILALKERKVSFKQTASTKTLYTQLVEAVEASGEA